MFKSGQPLSYSLCKVKINNLNKKIDLPLLFSIVLLRSDIQHIILHIFFEPDLKRFRGIYDTYCVCRKF